MKMKAKWLSAGILITYLMMALPWSLKTIWFEGDTTYHWFRYTLGMLIGDPLSSVSGLLAFTALIVSLFSTFGKVRRPIVCGILLLFSAVVEIVNGCVFGFERFTVFTYSIIAVLMLLGFFALFGFLGIRQNDETERVQSNDV